MTDPGFLFNNVVSESRFIHSYSVSTSKILCVHPHACMCTQSRALMCMHTLIHVHIYAWVHQPISAQMEARNRLPVASSVTLFFSGTRSCHFSQTGCPVNSQDPLFSIFDSSAASCRHAPPGLAFTWVLGVQIQVLSRFICLHSKCSTHRATFSAFHNELLRCQLSKPFPQIVNPPSHMVSPLCPLFPS